jgi:hypothetical protein
MWRPNLEIDHGASSSDRMKAATDFPGYQFHEKPDRLPSYVS